MKDGGADGGTRRSLVLLVSGTPIATGQCLHLIEDGGGPDGHTCSLFTGSHCYGSVPTSHGGWVC